MLRNDVVEGVMTVNPIIKAVHRGTDASPIERYVATPATSAWNAVQLTSRWPLLSDLLPHIELRDEVSAAIAKKDTERQSLDDELRRIQIEAIQIGKRNTELASEVLALAKARYQNSAESIDDAAAREEIARLEQGLKASRQKWKVMKGTASAVVAGSGVDWVNDAELRDIVLDPD
jgi:hypothetical protein